MFLRLNKDTPYIFDGATLSVTEEKKKDQVGGQYRAIKKPSEKKDKTIIAL